MKLAENEERALKQLRGELSARYPIIDFRLYGSKARGEGRQDGHAPQEVNQLHREMPSC